MARRVPTGAPPRRLRPQAAEKKLSPEDIARQMALATLVTSEGWGMFLREIVAPKVHRIFMTAYCEDPNAVDGMRMNARSLVLLRKIIQEAYAAAKESPPTVVMGLFGAPLFDSDKMNLR